MCGCGSLQGLTWFPQTIMQHIYEMVLHLTSHQSMYVSSEYLAQLTLNLVSLLLS